MACELHNHALFVMTSIMNCRLGAERCARIDGTGCQCSAVPQRPLALQAASALHRRNGATHRGYYKSSVSWRLPWRACAAGAAYLQSLFSLQIADDRMSQTAVRGPIQARVFMTQPRSVPS